MAVFGVRTSCTILKIARSKATRLAKPVVETKHLSNYFGWHASQRDCYLVNVVILEETDKTMRTQREVVKGAL